MEVASPEHYFLHMLDDLPISCSPQMVSSMMETSARKRPSRCEDDDRKREMEPLVNEDRGRYCLFPIRYGDIWKAYKDHKNAFWTAEEIDFAADRADWDQLKEEERFFIEHILAFFASSDGIVLENLVQNFCAEIAIPEVRCFYTFQAMMENIHSEVYSLLIDTYIQDPQRKQYLFEAIHRIPCIEKKAQWAIQ